MKRNHNWTTTKTKRRLVKRLIIVLERFGEEYKKKSVKKNEEFPTGTKLRTDNRPNECLKFGLNENYQERENDARTSELDIEFPILKLCKYFIFAYTLYGRCMFFP